MNKDPTLSDQVDLMNARSAFDLLLSHRLIPEFCSDPSRRMDPTGFIAASNTLMEEDATDFMRAWQAGLAAHQGRGHYYIANGRIKESFFWDGRRAPERRSFTLWLEPVITMGAVARMHLDHGWPIDFLTAQSEDWAFDIMASKDGLTPSIAGEVKKTTSEVDKLFRLMVEYGANPHAHEPKPGPAQNAFRKMASLRKNGASTLWLVGPGRYELVFEANRLKDGVIQLAPAPSERLSFQ